MSRQLIKKMPAACHELKTDSKDLKAIERRDLARMLFLLYLIRDFEQMLLDLQDEAGLVHGPVHSSIGQEAIAAAAGVALRKTDMLGSSHRAHGHFLAKACMYYAPDDFDPTSAEVPSGIQDVVNRTMAEIMGLAAGWCKGRGGSMHLYDEASGNLGSNGIVGGGIPIATGAAWAEKIRGRDAVVVSFFGDGAVNQGCLHEVANLGALWNVPVIYFVENNAFAVGTPTEQSSYLSDLGLRSLSYGIESLIVDGMDPVAVFTALAAVTKKMRLYPFPFLIEARTYRYYHHSGSLPGSAYGYRSKEEEAEWRAKDPLVVFPNSLLEADLIREAENESLRGMARACVHRAMEFSTAERDGKRYIPKEKWPRPETLTEDLRGPEDSLAGIRFVEREDFSEFQTMTYVEAVAAATRRSMERDDRVYVLGEEVANFGGGAYQATKGIPRIFPERVLNTPISECGFIGLAAGGACRGLRPVVEIMYPDFTLVAADQLFNQIGKLRHMYGGHVRFPLVLRTCMAQGGYGGQHSMDPAGLFALFSGWRIVAPSNAFDYIGLFNTAMAYDDPVLIVEHRSLYPEVGDVPSDTLDYHVEYGKANVVRSGEDLTVLTYLTGVPQCAAAADDLSRQGINVEVVDIRTLDYLGMDYQTIGESVKKTHSVLIVEFAARSLGIAARISDEIQERFFDELDCPVAKLTAPDIPPPVSKALEEATFPSIDRIKDCMIQGSKHHF